MKFKVNQPDGIAAEVSAQNKTIAYKKIKEWLGTRFAFTMRDVYKVITIVILLTSTATFAQDKKQCAGITKAGTQCKHKTATTYCKVHDPASPRCGAKTKDGQPCKMAVKESGTKCHNHKD